MVPSHPSDDPDFGGDFAKPKRRTSPWLARLIVYSAIAVVTMMLLLPERRDAREPANRAVLEQSQANRLCSTAVSSGLPHASPRLHRRRSRQTSAQLENTDPPVSRSGCALSNGRPFQALERSRQRRRIRNTGSRLRMPQPGRPREPQA